MVFIVQKHNSKKNIYLSVFYILYLKMPCHCIKFNISYFLTAAELEISLLMESFQCFSWANKSVNRTCTLQTSISIFWTHLNAHQQNAKQKLNKPADAAPMAVSIT